MSKKTSQIAERIKAFRGRTLDAHYLAYFDCFNRQMFYEAHDVLEELWLPDRRGADGDFYKGLIQLAGAFVHLQKRRLDPARALLRLARANLEKYSMIHRQLDLCAVIATIADWSLRLAQAPADVNQCLSEHPPTLSLIETDTYSN